MGARAQPYRGAAPSAQPRLDGRRSVRGDAQDRWSRYAADHVRGVDTRRAGTTTEQTLRARVDEGRILYR